MQETWPSHQNVVPAKHVTLLLEFNVDGVALFKHATKHTNFTPILGRLFALRGDLGTFTFANTEPFMVGYWVGCKDPPDRIMRDLVRELRSLHPSRLENVLHAEFCRSTSQTSPATAARRSTSPSEPFESDSESDDVRNDDGSYSDDMGEADESSDTESPMPPTVDNDSSDSDDSSTSEVENEPVSEESESELDEDYLLDELQLQPSADAEFVPKTISAKLHFVVADAPATSKLTGKKGHSGYLSLPRCKHPGQTTGIKGSNTVYFPQTNCKNIPRLNHEFAGYANLAPGEKNKVRSFSDSS